MPRNRWRSCFSLAFAWNGCKYVEWFLATSAVKRNPKTSPCIKPMEPVEYCKWPRFLPQHTNQCKVGFVPLASASPDNPTPTCMLWICLVRHGEARRVTAPIGYYSYVASSLQPALQSVEIWINLTISCNYSIHHCVAPKEVLLTVFLPLVKL